MNGRDAFEVVLEQLIEAKTHISGLTAKDLEIREREAKASNLAIKAREVLSRMALLEGGGDPALDRNKVDQALAFLTGIIR